MMAVHFALVRIDDRLIHGQVVLNWVRMLRPRRIAVVDPDLATNPWASALLRAAAPPGLVLWVGSAEQAVEVLLKQPSFAPETTIVLLRSPGAAQVLYKAGVPYSALNVGCLGAGPGRIRVTAQVSLTQHELEVLQSLASAGVAVTLQAIPSERPMSLDQVAHRLSRAGLQSA